MPRDGDTRQQLLDATVQLILAKGYEAMRIDDVCQRTGLTKGAVFHHFRNKEDLALAAADHFAARAAAVFESGAYNQAGDPRERLLAYVDQRRAMMDGGLQDFTCLFGMMAQETYVTHPAISSACGRHIADHARTLEPSIAAAARADLPGDPASLAIFIQAVVQGAFVIAKARQDPAVAWACLDHLKHYLSLALVGAPRAETVQ